MWSKCMRIVDRGMRIVPFINYGQIGYKNARSNAASP